MPGIFASIFERGFSFEIAAPLLHLIPSAALGDIRFFSFVGNFCLDLGFELALSTFARLSFYQLSYQTSDSLVGKS